MANPYYTPSGVPATQTRGTSANQRAEFNALEGGFDDVYAEILSLAAAVGIAVSVTEADVASSATTDIGNGYGPVVKITGNNAITSFGANYTGAKFLRFADVLTLTHSASLVLPGAAPITTIAGDACIAVPIGNPASGWRIMAYCRMSLGLVDDVAVRTSSTYANPAWLTSLGWSKITGTPTTIAGYGITDAPTKTGTGASGSWGIDITGWAKSAGAGADIASAATVDLTGRTGNIVSITGSTPTSAFTIEDGGRAELIAPAGWELTYHATNNPVQGGQTYICQAGDRVVVSADGASGLHVQIIESLLPGKAVGEIFEFSGTTAPPGSLACPVAATNISRTTYARLFAAIGTTWGAGDGSTTFGMPWFPANYASVQANANVGTNSVGENLAHTHAPSAGGNFISNGGGGGDVNGSGSALRFSAATTSNGGSANLAAGVRVLKCVKY